MGRCTHLAIGEREGIMCTHRAERSVGDTARAIGKGQAHGVKGDCPQLVRARLPLRALAGLDRPATLRGAQETYRRPRQLERRITLERPDLAINDTAIYRGIRSGGLGRFIGSRKASAGLRRSRCRRKRRDAPEPRGKIKVSR